MNLVSSSNAHSDAAEAGTDRAASRRWVSFELAGQQYAIAILKVFEVLLDADIEPVPNAPEAVLGVINLRGSIVTVVELGVLLGIQRASMRHCIIVINHEDQAIGVRVDRILEVLDIQENAMSPVPPGADSNAASRVIGYVKYKEELLSLLEFTGFSETLEKSLAA